MIPAPPIFDGHNDTLLRLYLRRRSLFQRHERGHLDLPRAREGGLMGGIFAIWVPPEGTELGPLDANASVAVVVRGDDVPLAPAIDPTYAQRLTLAIVEEVLEAEAASDGQVRVVRTVDDLGRCLATGALALVLHFEGAEAIDPELVALEGFYKSGLRSLGLVWSRANAFGYGVPFRFPHSPDTGPGLTDAGRELVRACNRLGILVDLAHLNERGFWDVAALSDAPLVASHTAAHALCPSARNLTDAQLDAVGESGGLVGVTFCVSDLRADGRSDPDTPLDDLVRHIGYIADRLGPDHVALGSDFDGAPIPAAIGDATGLPRLVAALREYGFDEATLVKVCYRNWWRVLGATWQK